VSAERTAVLAAGFRQLASRTAEGTRAKADEILARPEFSGAKPTLVQRLTRSVGRLIGAAFNGLVEGGINAVIAWAILLGIAVVVALVVWRLTRDARAQARLGVVVEAGGVPRSAQEWRTQADGHEARGEWKDALRARYRALVGELIARRVLRDLPGRTTGEFRAEVAIAVPQVAAAFGEATDLFERAWYGHRSTGPAECERFRSLADQVLAGARSVAGHAAGAAAEPAAGVGAG
jgi:hypothetical protein